MKDVLFKLHYNPFTHCQYKVVNMCKFTVLHSTFKVQEVEEEQQELKGEWCEYMETF